MALPTGRAPAPAPAPSPHPFRRQTDEKGTYYLDLSVLSDLVDLDLLGASQGVVQGLWRGLRQLTGGGRGAHHGLCGEGQKASGTSPRRAAPAPCKPLGFLPSPAPHPHGEERELLLPSPVNRSQGRARGIVWRPQF